MSPCEDMDLKLIAPPLSTVRVPEKLPLVHHMAPASRASNCPASETVNSTWPFNTPLIVGYPWTHHVPVPPKLCPGWKLMMPLVISTTAPLATLTTLLLSKPCSSSV